MRFNIFQLVNFQAAVYICLVSDSVWLAVWLLDTSQHIAYICLPVSFSFSRWVHMWTSGMASYIITLISLKVWFLPNDKLFTIKLLFHMSYFFTLPFFSCDWREISCSLLYSTKIILVDLKFCRIIMVVEAVCAGCFMSLYIGKFM